MPGEMEPDDRDDGISQQPEPGGISLTPSEAKRYQETTAAKFFSLDASIQTVLDNISELLKAPTEKHGGKTYLCFGELNNDEFEKALRELNRCIAKAQTLFSTEIDLQNSTPEFIKYKNLLHLVFDECITKHSESIFFEKNAEDGRYLYPYKKLSVGLKKIGLFLADVQGKLDTSGAYIKDEPLTKPSHSSGMDGGQFYGGGGGYGAGYGTGYGGAGLYNPNIYNPLSTDESRHQPEKRKVLRDIGDSMDGI